ERNVCRTDEAVSDGKERQRRGSRYGVSRDADQYERDATDEQAGGDHAFFADELANRADQPSLDDGAGQPHHGENVPDRASGGSEAVKGKERERRLERRQREGRQKGHDVEPGGVGLKRLQAGGALVGLRSPFGAEGFGQHSPDDHE